jgi:glycerol uptake facilitator-like aquaporin
MNSFDLPRRFFAEALGTGLLVATVVGSGIMAETLTHDTALALLVNTLATRAMLVVLITVLGPISGAHSIPPFRWCSASTGRCQPAILLPISSRRSPAALPARWRRI